MPHHNSPTRRVLSQLSNAEALRKLGHRLVRPFSDHAGLVPIRQAANALAHRDVVIIQPSGIRNRARVLKIARSLLDSGRSVAFFTKLPAETGGDEVLVDRVFGCPVLHFPDVHTFLKPAKTRIPAVNWELMVQYLRATMWHYVQTIQPRVIHTFNTPAIGLGHDFRDRLRAAGHDCRWFHDYQEYAAGHSFRDDRVPDAPPDEEWRQVVLRHEAAHAAHPDHAFTVSDALARAIQQDYGLAKAPTVLLNVPRRSDFDPAYRPTIRQALALGADVPLLVYSGGVTPLRGLHTVISALRELPRVHLAIMTQANTPYVHSLVQTAREGGYADRLHFLPYLDPDKVPSFLQDATAGVHPLVRYGNAEVALPNKLFDYLHAGLPVVVSNCAAMADFVRRHACGEIFAAEDPSAMADAVNRLIAGATPPKAALRALADRVNWEEQERALEEVYQTLSNGSLHQPPTSQSVP